ncbi:SIMPL domain-containing protein [Chryseobacterium indoltheticum]|jgi:uncharacterized protein YggE|uniref:SIMPL domain-containing protein n=1 Tax=Chryseobacterium indoltheticum TaxID=254 RepID=UPI00242B82A4|nr:SIMPL domain-containing protein [Chryseobacterium indoltheticum]MDF2831418.1 hypothetical protein [Chryseobacterium indoltheticum]
MKNILCLTSAFFFQFTFAQFSGNINYQNQVRYQENNISINVPVDNHIVISIKGMANVKADKYVAIFSLTQVAETADEANSLMDKRLNTALNQIKINKGIETYVDMVSFVPVYQYAVEKKIFSRKTYNEVPTGFELKKNLHIQFSDPSQLNEFISVLSKNEIYDLVRVDYFANSLETIKKDLMNKAKIALQEKAKNYETLLGESFANSEKSINDGFQVKLPTEMYKSYEAYNSSSLALTKLANVNKANKSTTLYYQPVFDKEFDFVINPTILEPFIQVMYEVKLVINKEKKDVNKESKSYILITPNGEMRDLNISKSNK